MWSLTYSATVPAVFKCHAKTPAIQTQESWLSCFLFLWTPHLEFTPTRPSLDTAQPKLQALVYDILPPWRKVPASGARSVRSTLSSFKAKLNENLSLFTVFPQQLISVPNFCYSHCVCASARAYVFVCVCVCPHIKPYVNCSGRTVLYVCIEYCVQVNICRVSAQGVDDERMINVHYYSSYYYYSFPNDQREDFD